jgi:hypothetical protein
LHFTPLRHGLDKIFLCGWSKMYQFPHRPMGLTKHGSERNHEKQPQLPSTAHPDISINKKIAEKFLAHVWG